ncbi:uncharacterized protein MONBRDRAFT_28381 [Monosiga brevicollis MX1]|uniref:Enoyl reductase (ER) domain-containing protein n=1 Tax=Monosiga brevicollis TaxID=81824 RepID=A9V805_MONBE|nr:uncharacterized protein MONBRDRAFT_28381 [Monosiga brevicollis MX1]EDQ86395.1 predicted protein [Monosiga brevicollis MX1]|eukprot:XP_001748785.1 hypothetical protein [Monosiga brevicollis MX1]
MKAVQVAEFGGPEVLQIAEVPIPHPRGTQVLVKLGAVGINPVETYLRAGAYASLPQLPFTPGKDGAGVVHACGEDVSKFKPGDRVYTTGSLTGTYAVYTLCTDDQLQPLPERITLAAGAAIGIAYRTAYRALFQRATFKPRDAVLIHGGSGGVGLAAIQLAAMHGAEVLATAGTEKGLQLMRDSGAHHVFNHREPDYLNAIKAATPGKGIKLIVEMLANVNLQHDLDLIGRHGTIAVVGNRGEININPRTLMLAEANIVGVLGGTPDEISEAYHAINAGLAVGALTPVIGPAFTLEQAPEAHVEVIEHKQGTSGKIVLVPSQLDSSN